MSTRERWIVYPLLFLALGLALRDKILPASHMLVGEIAAGQIRCNQFQADRAACNQLQAEQAVCNRVQSDQVICKRLGATGGIATGNVQCGELMVVGSNGRPTVLVGTDTTTKGGLITTLSRTGAPLVLLRPTESGGVVEAADVKRIAVSPEKSNTPPDSVPKEPSKEPEKTPAKGP